MKDQSLGQTLLDKARAARRQFEENKQEQVAEANSYQA